MKGTVKGDCKIKTIKRGCATKHVLVCVCVRVSPRCLRLFACVCAPFL